MVISLFPVEVAFLPRYSRVKRRPLGFHPVPGIPGANDARRPGKWTMMSQPASSSNVLTTLDDRVPTSGYAGTIAFALIAVLGLDGFIASFAVGVGGVLVCFAALCALATVFVWKFLPETKELPVEEIVRLFDRESRAATGADRRSA
jgi:hypothetical protein